MASARGTGRWPTSPSTRRSNSRTAAVAQSSSRPEGGRVGRHPVQQPVQAGLDLGQVDAAAVGGQALKATW